MRRRICFVALALGALAAGCGGPIAGTWVSSGEASPDNPIAGVTFCHDNTFTAGADYGGGKTETMSGCYMMKGDRLMLCMKDGTQREYTASVDKGCLKITHKDKTQTLCRLKCACCGSACCAK